jgi:uncharacterized membrane protein affecting hemolysin expression
LSLGAFCTLLVATLVFEHRIGTLVKQQSQDYGMALARMAAHQGVDATLNHDLVSMQVILQDVVANPGVLLATIHDVENNLLVQAGDALFTRTTDIPLDAYSAPITLHDSVAGYVTVTLAITNNHHRAVVATVGAIMLLLALIGILSLHEHRAQVFVRRPDRPSADGDRQIETEAGEQDPELEMSEEEDNGSAASVLARVRVLNFPALHRQLSADTFHTARNNLERLLDEVLALYGGRRRDPAAEPALPGQPDDYLLQFEDRRDGGEAAFRAICSTYLLMQLAAQLLPFPFRLSAEIIPLGSADGLSEASTLDTEELLITQELAQQTLLQERLEFIDEPAPQESYQLKDFQQPFKALLDKQYQQLKRI